MNKEITTNINFENYFFIENYLDNQIGLPIVFSGGATLYDKTYSGGIVLRLIKGIYTKKSKYQIIIPNSTDKNTKSRLIKLATQSF